MHVPYAWWWLPTPAKAPDSVVGSVQRLGGAYLENQLTRRTWTTCWYVQLLLVVIPHETILSQPYSNHGAMGPKPTIQKPWVVHISTLRLVWLFMGINSRGIGAPTAIPMLTNVKQCRQ